MEDKVFCKPIKGKYRLTQSTAIPEAPGLLQAVLQGVSELHNITVWRYAKQFTFPCFPLPDIQSHVIPCDINNHEPSFERRSPEHSYLSMMQAYLPFPCGYSELECNL